MTTGSKSYRKSGNTAGCIATVPIYLGLKYQRADDVFNSAAENLKNIKSAALLVLKSFVFPMESVFALNLQCGFLLGLFVFFNQYPGDEVEIQRINAILIYDVTDLLLCLRAQVFPDPAN